MNSLTATRPTAQSFAPFGTLLDKPARPATTLRGDISFWHATGDLSDLNGSGVTAYLTAHQREALLDRVERHNQTCEAFISIHGQSLFVVAPPGDLDPLLIRVFLLEPGQSVLLHRGTWHWAPFPIRATADFLLLLRAETPDQDIEIQEIPPLRLLPLESVPN